MPLLVVIMMLLCICKSDGLIALGNRRFMTQQKILMPNEINADDVGPQVNQNKCLYFSGAGVYIFWQLGAAKYLRETCQIDNTHIFGASAGSIVGLLLKSDIDFDEAITIALEMAKNHNIFNSPLPFKLGNILHEYLKTIIPDSISRKTLTNLSIAVTPLFGAPRLIQDFQSKEEVIESVLTSCHIPWLLDGRMSRNYRNEEMIDGSFYYFLLKDRLKGLPLPTANYNPENIFWIDYSDDREFMDTISNNILESVDSQKIISMVNKGYSYMKKQHKLGNLPTELIEPLPISPRRKTISKPTPSFYRRYKLSLPLFPSTSV